MSIIQRPGLSMVHLVIGGRPIVFEVGPQHHTYKIPGEILIQHSFYFHNALADVHQWNKTHVLEDVLPETCECCDTRSSLT